MKQQQIGRSVIAAMLHAQETAIIADVDTLLADTSTETAHQEPPELEPGPVGYPGPYDYHKEQREAFLKCYGKSQRKGVRT